MRRHRLAITGAVRALADEAVVSHVSAAVAARTAAVEGAAGAGARDAGTGFGWETRTDRARARRAAACRRDRDGRRRRGHVHGAHGGRHRADGAVRAGGGRARRGVWPGGSSTAAALAEALLRDHRVARRARRRDARSRSPIRVPRASASRAAGWRSCGRACPGRCFSGRSPTGPATSSAARTSAGLTLGAVGEFDGEVKYGRLLRAGQSPGDVVFAEKVREDRIRATELGMARWAWDELGPAFGPVAARIRAQFRLTHTMRGSRTWRALCVSTRGCASGGEARLHLAPATGSSPSGRSGTRSPGRSGCRR